MKSTQLALIICAGSLMRASNLCSAPPTVEELEHRCIKYRLENVKQGYVRMLVVDDPHPQAMERLYESTFDENRVRQVRRVRLVGRDKWGGAEKIIVTPRLYMSDHGDVTYPPNVQINPAADHGSLREKSRVLNLQALGMDISGVDMLHTAHLETLLNRADRTKPIVQTDRCDDLETWRIDYDFKRPSQISETHVRIWIAPSQGDSVVRLKLQTNQNGKLRTCVVDTQLKRYPIGGVWFPFKVTKTLELDGLVLNRQVTAVEEARFGEPIDDAAFTSAGLELKPGRQVVDSTSGQPWLKVWDGKDLADPSVVRTATPSRDNRRWFLWTSSVGLALMAVIYFWRFYRGRKSSAGSGA